MTMQEVELAMGESSTKITTSDGQTEWMYPRSNSVLVVRFNQEGIVREAKAQATGSNKTRARRKASESSRGQRLTGNGTPLQ